MNEKNEIESLTIDKLEKRYSLDIVYQHSISDNHGKNYWTFGRWQNGFLYHLFVYSSLSVLYTGLARKFQPS